MTSREILEQRTRVAIIKTCLALFLKYGKWYHYATMGKMIELLKQYHDIEIGRRTLWYHLTMLENEGIFTRTERTRKNDLGRKHYTSSLTKLTQKGFYYLKKLGRWGQTMTGKLKNLLNFPNTKRDATKRLNRQAELSAKSYNERESSHSPTSSHTSVLTMSGLPEICKGIKPISHGDFSWGLPQPGPYCRVK